MFLRSIALFLWLTSHLRWFVEVPLQVKMGLSILLSDSSNVRDYAALHQGNYPNSKYNFDQPTCGVAAPLQPKGDSQPDAQAHRGGDQDQDDCQGGPGVGGDGVDGADLDARPGRDVVGKEVAAVPELLVVGHEEGRRQRVSPQVCRHADSFYTVHNHAVA